MRARAKSMMLAVAHRRAAADRRRRTRRRRARSRRSSTSAAMRSASDASNGQRVGGAGRGERAVQRGRAEVVAQLHEDAEHVPQREPLVRPVAAPVPEVDDVGVAARARRAGWPCRAWSQSTSVSANAWIHRLPAPRARSAACCRCAAASTGSVRLERQPERVRAPGRCAVGEPDGRAAASASPANCAPLDAVAEARVRHRAHVERVGEAGRRVPRRRTRSSGPSSRCACAVSPR